MPVMDGYAATQELRRAGLGIPIFALTANAMKGCARCLDAGCSGYLAKPIDQDLLLAAVAAAVRRQTTCRVKFDSQTQVESARAEPVEIAVPEKLVSRLPTTMPNSAKSSNSSLVAYGNSCWRCKRGWPTIACKNWPGWRTG